MILCTAPPSLLPPPVPSFSMSSDPNRSRYPDERPVLPPIRDLFRELSSSRSPPESPATTLARLRVNEDDAHYGYASSSSRPPSRSHTDPTSYAPSARYPANAVAYDPARPTMPPPPGPYPDYPTPPRAMSYDRNYPVPPTNYDPRLQPPHGYYPPPLPPTLSTTIHGGPLADDRTPVARYQPSGMPGYAPQDASSAKYECTYCGKGFTRPSSLKIHLNSHTGEKPFVCPVDGCGRSFSVLSNMRRHARVHVAPAAADDEHQQQRSSALAGPSTSSASQWTHHHRRDSSGGASSSSSRRSHSESSEEEDYDYYDRPEKRTRHRRR
uniref:C2H2-type domain-containing protein n=1 Tax=Mycena chlorophos TaxID=658473 RepID=A0ABQ0L2S7_MYCCL|nr:predicted protein [Mycena chlorophos]